MDVRISSIKPGKNPRRFFDPTELAELEASIRANGVLQPILIRPLAGGDNYEIVAGERRWRAAKAVFGDDGVIPVNIREMSDDEAEVAALVENTLRADMAPSDEAEAAHMLVLKFKGDRAEASAQLGWSMSKLLRRLALMEATSAVREALSNRRISLGHAELLAAAPKDKQDGVLEKVIASNVTVAVLKDQLSRISLDLAAAIFDKGECGACPHNSSLQASMFTESVASGNCTNPTCFSAKTEAKLVEIVAEHRDTVPRVELVRPGSVLETIPVVAKGRVGVGKEQMEACKGCGNYGLTVSALPGSEGRIETGLCFDAACNLEKVAAYLKTLAPEAAADGKGAPAKGKPKPVAKANQSAAPQRLKDYRVQVWKDALKAELGKDVFVAGTALLAIALSGNAHHISRSQIGIEVKGSTIGEFYAAMQKQSGSDVSRLIGLLPASAVQGLSEADVRRLLEAMDCNLAEHWVINAEFLDLLTKSEIEALAGEIGLKDALGESYKKVLSGKKSEIIAGLLKVSGFEYQGAVPSCMQYAEATKKKAKAPAQSKPDQEQTPTQEPCCA